MSSRLDYCNSLLYGMADNDFTKLQRDQNWLTRVATKSPPFTRSVPVLHWLPVKFIKLFKISLFTYKTLHEKQPAYLHPMLAVSLPSRSPTSNKGISLSVPRVKINTGARAFHLAPLLFGTTSRCLSVQPFQLLPSRNISRHISLTRPFSHRHRHARWPIDVTKLLHRFWCWTPIRQPWHWAWLHRGYWHYRNLIDLLW